MEFVGDESRQPRAEGHRGEDPAGVFEELLGIMAVIWQTCDLVHADFSEYNILSKDGELWVIDAGQAVTTRHPSAGSSVGDVTRLTEAAQGPPTEVADSLVRVLDGPAGSRPTTG